MVGLNWTDALVITGVLMIAAGFSMLAGLAAVCFWLGGCLIAAGIMRSIYGVRR